jgi:arylsulfatase A-like enzyme
VRGSREILGRAASVSKGAAALVAAALGACAGASEPPPRANVLIVLVDTLRRDRLGCYGYGRPTSPALDRLAQESILFERCLAPSSWTEPSTASLLCGLYPARHGAHEYVRIPGEVVMLAEVLREAGWRTAAVSGNPNASAALGFDQGFEEFVSPPCELAREYPDVTELVARAEELIGRPDPRPWLLYLHVMNVHGPYRSPPGFRERFLDEPWREFPFQNEIWKDLLRKGRVERRADVTPEHLRDLRARYDGAVAYTDEVLGAFLRERLEAGGAQADLVVVTADHGEELFDHGGFGHGFTLHHEVVDVPLLLRRPGAAGGGTRVAHPVSLVDVPATLLDLLGLLPAQAGGGFGDGRSLKPLFEGRSIERDAPLASQLLRVKQGRAFLLEQWPLRAIATEHDYAGRRGVLELFDLERDPREERDLSAVDPERAHRLADLLRRRRAELEARALRADEGDLSEEERRRIDALGYGDGAGAALGR